MEASEPRRRRPAIVCVDDEPAVLAAVARDLRRQFGERYRIVRATSGDEALTALKELVTRGEQVALLVADQRMPGMSGTEYLVEARKLVPDAKRVLLTAYADTEAAIQAINEVDLDYYLLKPWDPPEEQLYPVVEDLLTTWEAGAALESGGVRVIGHRFSRDSHDLRDFLARNRVPMRWLDVERDAEARELLTVADVNGERPAGRAAGGRDRCSSARRARAGRAARRARRARGRPLRPRDRRRRPRRARRRGLRRLRRAQDRDGRARGARRPGRDSSSRIENYLGFPAGLSGSDLARRAIDQARRLGAELLSIQDAIALRVEGAGRIVELSGGGTLSANCVLVASGVSYQQAERARLRELHRQGHLLRRGADRGALVQGPARRDHRRRELRRPGRGALLPATPARSRCSCAATAWRSRCRTT